MLVLLDCLLRFVPTYCIRCTDIITIDNVLFLFMIEFGKLVVQSTFGHYILPTSYGHSLEIDKKINKSESTYQRIDTNYTTSMI